MNILFFLVHPAKFQFHKIQINELKKRGHNVDVVITKKDILEDLVKEAGWEYTNIFPEGRKIKSLHVYLGALISLFKTVKRLYDYTKGKKYDIFIGDLLTIVGRLRGVPSLYPTDDVIRQVPEQSVFLFSTKHIIAPFITNLGVFNKKKVNYDGYKALAHLHPNQFKPDINVVKGIEPGEKFFLIRCTGFNATHDIGKYGVDDHILREIISILKNKGKIFISSERELPEDIRPYQLKIKKEDVHHYMAFADMFIGDSTTMCTEAAILGTPTVEYDNYWFEIEQMLELEFKYNLLHLFQPPNYKGLLEKIETIINTPDAKKIYSERANKFMQEKIDVSAFLIWFIENYPKSFEEYSKNPFMQYKFR